MTMVNARRSLLSKVNIENFDTDVNVFECTTNQRVLNLEYAWHQPAGSCCVHAAASIWGA